MTRLLALALCAAFLGCTGGGSGSSSTGDPSDSGSEPDAPGGGEEPGGSEPPQDPPAEEPLPPLEASALPAVGAVELRWSSSASAGLASYTVHRAIGDGSFSAVASGLTTTSYTDTSVTASSTYRYYVLALDAAGLELQRSAEVSARPVEAPQGATPCTDGIDNDGDGLVDAMDSGCSDLNERTERNEAPLGINLAKHQYDDSQIVFANAFQRNNGWRGHSASSLVRLSTLSVPLDANGYPLEVPYDSDGSGPAEAQVVGTTIFSSDIVYPTGTYTLLFSGTGRVRVNHSTFTVCAGTGSGRCAISIPSGGVSLGLMILESRREDPVRDIHLLLPGVEEAADGRLVNPRLLALLGGLSVLRSMDLVHANHHACSNGRSPSDPACVTTWSGRKTPGYYSQEHHALENGVAIEYVIALANEAQVDPWLNIPHAADDAYIAEMAAVAHRLLAPERKVYLELSNEVWNGGFSQAGWFEANGLVLYPGMSGRDARLRFYVRRSARMFAIFTQEFAGEEDRLVRVLGTQESSDSTSERLLGWMADPAVNADNADVDAIALAGYFGGSIVQDVLNQGRADSVTADEILDGAEQSLATVAGWFRAQKTVADRHGVRLLAYEGGQHLVCPDNNRPQALVDKLIEANRHPRMGELTRRLLDSWYQSGGGVFCYYLLVKQPAEYGSWGALEHMEQTAAQAPKYGALQEVLSGFGAEVR